MHSAEHVPWTAVFGNAHPVEVEIGPGRGEILFAAAAAAPARNFFAVERTLGRVEALRAGWARRGLTNVHAIAADARCVLARFVGDATVAAYHVYFPDPWPKNHHRDRRLLTSPFAADVYRTLVPGAALHLATDLPDLLARAAAVLVGAGLVRVVTPPPRRPLTHFERRYAVEGTHYARFVRPAAPTAPPT